MLQNKMDISFDCRSMCQIVLPPFLKGYRNVFPKLYKELKQILKQGVALKRGAETIKSFKLDITNDKSGLPNC